MSHPNKSKLQKMVAQAGGKENFGKILPVPSRGTRPMKASTIAKWHKRMEGK